jgi:hypothetical protein
VEAREDRQPEGGRAGAAEVLAAWREIEARSKNLPRGRIIKDETLADLALHPPADQEALGRVRGLSPAWRGNDIGGRLMEALGAGGPMDADEMPAREDRGPTLGKDGALVADLLKLLLKIRAKESNVAARLVARSDELEQLAAGKRTRPDHPGGWRFEEFGRDALDPVEGRLAFAVRKGKLVMTRNGVKPMQVWAGLIALGLMAGGCMPKDEEIPTREDPRYTCNAAKLQTMIGQTRTQAMGPQAMRTAGARTLRWIEPGSAYTMDYRTDRLNIHVDARGRVTRVNCG